MSNFAERIITQLDKGITIFEIARMFGGVQKLLDMSKKYSNLYAIIQTKLGGSLYCSAEGEDEVMIPFSLNFIMTELEEIDDGDSFYNNSSVNIIIPELTEDKEMQMLSSWLEGYLSDMGAEVGSFNDGKLNQKMIWIYAEKINGKSFKPLHIAGGVGDKDVLEIIPKEYKEP